MMKFRLGFVTNSSSTNHIILWRGDKEDLRFWLNSPRVIDSIPTETECFRPEGHIILDKEFIINDILAKVKEECFSSIDAIKRIQEHIKVLQNISKTAKNPNAHYIREWFIKEKQKTELYKKFDWVLSIYYGDEQATEIGYLMDYKGRYINIDMNSNKVPGLNKGKRFLWKTEQAR